MTDPFGCNVTPGLMDNDPDRLRRAAEYVETRP